MNIYQIVIWFFAFSLIGYLLECAVLSYENKTLVYDRGFGHGPFCIIYGFGAAGACVLLSPLADDPLKLYVASLLMATSMELVTARVMIHLFGAFWWDYSKKFMNYKGIICLQSSIAWGFLGIFFFRFLNGFINGMVSRVPGVMARRLAIALVLFYILDFGYTFRRQLKEQGGDEPVIGRLKV